MRPGKLIGAAISATLMALAGSVGAPAQILVNGAGATFPYPIYAKWFDEFHRVRSDADINYQSIGSGGGIRQLQAGVLDFGASDSPLTDEQLSRGRTRLLHFPTVVGAVVPIYTIPGLAGEINFTPEILAGIFLGTTRRWSAPELASANAGLRLPDTEIVPIHRSDGSGTTFIWTDFLSKTVPDWKVRVGASTSVKWPAGLGAKGNGGVAGLVRQTPNSIGYVELVYATQNRLAFGRVRNAGGRFVKADLATIQAAAAQAARNTPDDFRVSITNAPGERAYPVASFTWLLTPARIEDPQKRKIITEFLRWMLRDGQKMAEPLGYAPLPAPIAGKAWKAISRIR